MVRPHRLSIKLPGREAGGVSRECLKARKLVYVLLTDRKNKYAVGRSRVAHIGTTGNGVSRVLASLAYRARTILKWRGVRRCSVRLVTCGSRNGACTWHILERALLLAFRDMYGAVPRCNSQGRKMRPRKEHDYFRPARLRRVLEDLA